MRLVKWLSVAAFAAGAQAQGYPIKRCTSTSRSPRAARSPTEIAKWGPIIKKAGQYAD